MLFMSSSCRNLRVPTTLDLPDEGYSQSCNNETKQCYSMNNGRGKRHPASIIDNSNEDCHHTHSNQLLHPEF